MAEVYRFSRIEQVLTALDLLHVEDFGGREVLVKLHMGEPGNKFHVSPSLVKVIVGKLLALGAQPFLFDTTVAYPGPRATCDGYLEVARRHGFGQKDMGCRVVIGEAGVDVVVGANSFEVAEEIHESTHMVVVSHGKGHMQSGFGGAIKNLGMGGVTRAAKRAIHHMSVPRHSMEGCDLCGSCADACPCRAIVLENEWTYYSAACEGCGKCVPACPTGALTYTGMDLQKGLALSALACIRGKRVLYVNALVNIAANCDCDPNPGPIICPDIGYLASDEPAAIDRASLDLVHGVRPGVFEEGAGIDPMKQVRYAAELGLVSSYELTSL
jgi:uncharacterized Fe-S center protein